jgi:hypothetical protein
MHVSKKMIRVICIVLCVALVVTMGLYIGFTLS